MDATAPGWEFICGHSREGPEASDGKAGVPASSYLTSQSRLRDNLIGLKVKFAFVLKNRLCFGQRRGVADADVGHAAANAKPQRFRIKRVVLHDQESLRHR
jgi:hypothetical protein